MASGIMIIGPSGSGKTTLGKSVAEAMHLPFFDVDDYLWRTDTPMPYTVMYTREEKISRLKDAIAPYDHFVMAGSMSSFHEAFDDSFDMMVLLYTDPDTRIKRITARSIERFGDRVLEGGDMYESNLKFIQVNRSYEADGSPNLSEQRKWMAGLTCAKLELDGAESIEKNTGIVAAAYSKMLEEEPI